MKIEPFRSADIPAFLRLATLESWVASAWEFEFLLSVFPQGCFTAHNDEGLPFAFVTAIKHSRSGWIGNLIVAADHRGQGAGERLFDRALRALQEEGTETVWLTASRMGKQLYEKKGFTSIDTVIRWVGEGGRYSGPHKYSDQNTAKLNEMIDFDALAWGDKREQLLSAVAARGKTMNGCTGFATIQPCGGGRFQLGPFTGENAGEAESFLMAACSSVPVGSTLCTDVPASNKPAILMLKENGLQIAGINELMYYGAPPAYRPELLYGLATMGSCG